MVSRYLPLTLYSGFLAAAASLWLVQAMADVSTFPPLWLVVLSIAACLFVWQFGLPAPRVGLISMERLPQIGLLLVLSPPVAAIICGMASLLWPLVNLRYSQGSRQVATLRALHNSAMTAIMLLSAGYAYLAVGGRHPLDSLGTGDIFPLIVMAVVAQAVNVSLMAIFIRLDGRDLRRVLTPAYALSDLIFVPAGVLAAVLINSAPLATFLLFAGLMLLFVLSFNGIGPVLSADTESGSLARLSNARQALHGARHIDELGSRILTETGALIRFEEFYLGLVDRDRGLLDLRVHERDGTRLPEQTKPLGEGLFGWVVKRAEAVLIENRDDAPEALRASADAADRHASSVIAVPLIEEGSVIGIISVQHSRPRVYSDADLNLMRQLAEHLAPALADAQAFEDLEDYRQRLEERVAERTEELQQANREKARLIAALRERTRTLERESQEDPLTGIANRRRFDQRLDAEFELALAAGQPLTLAVADLDRFKIINDGLGHAVGDEVLRICAALMQHLCRTTDLVARVGGEEFALILPGMSRAAAVGFCESLRRTIENHDWTAIHPGLRVTLSIGLAQWDGSADSDGLLQAADTQLYRAKNSGRNRVSATGTAEGHGTPL